ncbi:MAG: hypothetical protein Q9N26_04465 [Aquificota bacterium]|nr:hypothetical protein [Aquificota bacterium]
MSKFQRHLLGFLSFIPPLYALLIVLTPLKGMFREGFLENLTTTGLVFLFVHFLVFSLLVFLYVVFLVHLLSGSSPRWEKAGWVCLFILLGPFSLPLYWFLRVR